CFSVSQAVASSACVMVIDSLPFEVEHAAKDCVHLEDGATGERHATASGSDAVVPLTVTALEVLDPRRRLRDEEVVGHGWELPVVVPLRAAIVGLGSLGED